jgi:hypothetical protein
MMRFWQKIERARLVSGMKFDPSHWYERARGVPVRLGVWPASACFIGFAAWYDGRERLIPSRMFELYPWLKESVEFGADRDLDGEHARELPCYIAIEELSHLVAQHELTWAEAYTFLELWEPKTFLVPRLEDEYLERLSNLK